MKSSVPHKPVALFTKVVALSVLVLILCGTLNSFSSGFSEHTEIKEHWSSATPMLEVPFEEKDKEDNENDGDSFSSQCYASCIRLSYHDCSTISLYSKSSKRLFSNLPVFLSIRSLRV